MNERILIVDDEQTLCYFLKESLEEKGYQVAAAHTARGGLEALMRQPVDLVLLDLKLPDGDGLSVLYEIKESDSDLPVIVLTGHAAVESAVQAMKLGAYDYLEKPINLAGLTSSVAQALDSRSRHSGGDIASQSETTGEHDPPVECRADALAAPHGDPGWEEWAQLSRMYRELERQYAEALALDSISSGMMRSLELDEVVERAVDGLLELSSVDMVAIFLAGRDAQELVLAHQRRFPRQVWESSALRRVSARGIAEGFAAGRGSAVPLSEVCSAPWVEEISARIGNDTLTVAVPLRDDDQLSGLMLIGRRGRHPFGSTQLEMFCSVAQRLSQTVSHASELGAIRERASLSEESMALYEAILRSMTDGLVLIDDEGKVRLVNRGAERLLGCREEQAIDAPVEEVLGSAGGIVRDSLDRALAFSGEEIVLPRGSGGSIPVEMGVSPIREDGGKLNGVVVILSDLSESRASEEERKRLDRQALLGEMSAVMAHELRNPLAGMMAGIQHLLAKSREGGERHEAMKRILQEGERLNRIIEDIVLISRPPQLNLSPCDISEVMEEVISLCEERAAAQGIQIRKYYAADLPWVAGDKVRLHQALSNLIWNGIEAMPDGGELSVVVAGPGAAEKAGGVKGGASWVEDGRVEVEIKDTGAGINREPAEIFQPFYSTNAGGTGLGLAITQRIIQEHGGDVQVESEEGAGTRFIVQLPLARRVG